MSLEPAPKCNTVRVKICGMTRPVDAVAAVKAGADAIGLNFYSGPRRIVLSVAREILTAVAGQISVVGLIDYAAQGEYSGLELYENLGLKIFQIYGVPATDHVESKNSRFVTLSATVHCWMVARIASRADLASLYSSVHESPFKPSAVLLDAASPTHHGGTGTTFNWQWIAQARSAGELQNLPPVVLAGGLTPQNVATAIRIVRPEWVDVASGVETGIPGIKDHQRMRDFIQATAMPA